MIQYVTGDILKSSAQALVNTVNTQGVMGKGIALQFKKEFPLNFKVYKEACRAGTFGVGDLLITKESSLHAQEKTVINFPTKTSWRLPSEYSYIEAGLAALVREIRERNIPSIAIPPLGAGNGGLDWERVKPILHQYLSALDCAIYIYEPNAAILEELKKERVKLTPARAMLLSVLYDLVRNGEFVSEFAAEKIAYFLQRFGANEQFKLDFKPNFYGPYSGKVKHVLYYLNGSYIMGYSSKDKKPFEELGLVPDGEQEVLQYLDEPTHASYKNIADKTTTFLSGFYSSFGLELLSTIDYLMREEKATSVEEIKAALEGWSDRKKTLFTSPEFIQIATRHLQEHAM